MRIPLPVRGLRLSTHERRNQRTHQQGAGRVGHVTVGGATFLYRRMRRYGR